MRPGRVVLVAALAVALAWARTAGAQGEPPVALVGAEGSALARRVRDELAALGHRVVVEGGAARVTLSESPAWLQATVTLAGGASRALQIERALPGAEASFALRVVETLRAELLAQRQRPRGAPVHAAPEAPPRVRTSLQAVGLWSPGGIELAFSPRVRAAFGATWSFELVLAGPSLGGAFETGSTRGTLRVLEAGLGVAAVVLRGRAGHADVGLRGSWLGVTASREAGTAQSTDRADLFAAWATVGGTLALGGALGLRADVAWGATLAPVVLGVGERLVAQWGRPLVALAAGLEARW